MHSVEPTSDTPPPPPEHLGMSQVDGCPECVLNVEAPIASMRITDGYRNAYICRDCGFSWSTEWGS